MVMDPRVKTSPADLQKQFALELKLVEAIQNAYRLVAEVHSAAESGRISADQESRLTGVARRRSEAASDQPSAGPTVASVIASLSQLLVAMDSADAAPTTQESQAAEKALGQLDSLTRQWQGLKK
jgi:CO/xanthine dehydrogenase Mo-binding subunit